MSKKENSQLLYDSYGEKMCLAPFLNSFYSTTNVISADNEVKKNTVKPCSLVVGNDWYIENDSILDARNNHVWKNMRKMFLDGKFEQLDVCGKCIEAERQGSSSARQLNNDYLFEHLDIDIMAELEYIINNDLQADRISALDYFPSNYCNYACIMCAGGASSGRLTFEIKELGKKLKQQSNPVDTDFYKLIKDVKILGFTGGETIMQPEVHKLIDYVIEHDLAKDMVITLLTNVSTFPETLVDKFKHFKRVLYTISIDGVGEVIEYQRRGSHWPTVEANALQIRKTEHIHEIVNFVVTAVNILNAMDFVDWCHDNGFKFIVISAVFQQHKMGTPALPPELRTLALQRLREGRKRYEHYLSSQFNNFQSNWVTTIDLLINTLENVEYDPTATKKFIDHIRIEDTVSKKPLREVVPEWAPWFAN